jgi:KipI family sensor histidine kinase inhibitor
MRILPLGEDGLLVRLADVADAVVAARAHALAEAVRAVGIHGVTEIVTSATAIALFYDRARTTHDAVAAGVTALPVARPGGQAAHAGRVYTIPVIYDGADLPVVAEQTGLAIDDVVARHAARTYTVYAVGFVPGFGYLGDVDPALVVPRRPTPRPRVPAGSVAIAGGQTAVYPLETPGGWHLIGRTEIRMFDPAADPPARLAVGDAVRFVVARAS